MAAANSFHRQPATTPRTVPLDSLQCVCRAGRIVTTGGRQQWRDRKLVATNHCCQDPRHDRSAASSIRWARCTPPIRSRRSSSKEAAYAFGCTRKTKSTALTPGRMCKRTISRSRRFSRFRSVVGFPDLGTTIATRGCDRGEDNARTSRNLVRARFPSRITSRSSARRVKRCVRGKPRSLGADVFRWKLNREALAAFLPTPTQCFPSPPSGHTGTKTVRLHTALVPGTVGRLSHSSGISN
jgi:hypothetical protein